MFDSVRTHRRWLLAFVLILVFPSFVFTGIYGYNEFVRGGDEVAEIDGEPIVQQDLDAAHRERVDRMRAMFGPQFDARLLETPQARAATLDGLLSERALSRQAQLAHVAVSEQTLREAIAAAPAFHEDGKFSYDRYRRLLAAQGMTEVGFEQRVRVDLARQMLLQAVTGSALVPAAVSEHVRRLAEERRQVRELRFEVGDFQARVAVTDAQIAAYYDAHQNEFRTQESARVEYVLLTLADVAAQVPAVTEADARAYYEKNQARFGQDEQRRASHILITAGEGGSAADRAGARKKAEELLARVRSNPAQFETLAREHSRDPGSASGGGDLGWFGRGMMVKPFEDAAFALKDGQVSEVIESDFGFHIVRVTGVRGAQARPFAEVRAQIEADLRREAAGKRFAEVAEQFTNAVYEQPDSLQPVADKLKLTVQTFEFLTRAGAPARPNQPQIFTPRVVEALFSPESIEKRRNTEAIEVASNVLVSARVVEHRPSAVRPLAEVRTQIKARVERAEAARLAREAGERKLAALRKDATEAGFGQPRVVSRVQPEGLPAAAVSAIMRVPAGQLPAFVGAELDGGGYAVFRVLSSEIPTTVDPAQAHAQSRALAQMFGGADEVAYVAAVRARFDARVLRTELKLDAAGVAGSAGKAAAQ